MGDRSRRQAGPACGQPIVKGGGRALGLVPLGALAALLPTIGGLRAQEGGSLPQVQVDSPAGRTESLRVGVAATIIAGPASLAPLQIRITPDDAFPKNSFVRVQGLPPAVFLSEGHPIAPGAWAVPLYALPTLKLFVPVGVSGRAEFSISLVSAEGAVLADVRSTLMVQQPPEPPRETTALPPPPTPPSFSPPPPVLSPADREVAERLVVRGEREVEQGNIAVARQFFLRAAQANLARGALLLAATYDPRELARWRVQGVQPNLAEARRWYERARDLGAPEATARLAGLGGG